MRQLSGSEREATRPGYGRAGVPVHAETPGPGIRRGVAGLRHAAHAWRPGGFSRPPAARRYGRRTPRDLGLPGRGGYRFRRRPPAPAIPSRGVVEVFAAGEPLSPYHVEALRAAREVWVSDT